MGSPTAFTLAELANVFVMIVALVCFFIMIIILLRNMAIVGIVGEGDVRMPWGGMTHKPPRLLMQRVHIPFTFRIINTSTTSYFDVSCMISSAVRYEMVSWWGPPVREMHMALWMPLRDLLHTDIVTKHCKHSDSLIRNNPHDERCMTLKLNESLDLGTPPRSCYPLVVVLARTEDDIKSLRPDDTVALISVVHIHDDICPLPSGILTQYLKQANGQISCLKQLYVSSGEFESGRTVDSGEASCEGCCVCAARPLSRALLPCRHACLCAACFLKLDKCPICRSPIQSYFCIRAEDEKENISPIVEKHSWTNAISHGLIDLLGHN